MYVCVCVCSVTSVVSDSLRPLGPQPTRLFCPWDFPSKNTGVGCQALLQGIFPTQGSNWRLLCLLHCTWILYRSATGEAPMNMWCHHLLQPHAGSGADLGSMSWIQYFSTDPCSFQGIPPDSSSYVSTAQWFSSYFNANSTAHVLILHLRLCPANSVLNLFMLP